MTAICIDIENKRIHDDDAINSSSERDSGPAGYMEESLSMEPAAEMMSSDEETEFSRKERTRLRRPPSVQDQSERFSRLLLSQTELHPLNASSDTSSNQNTPQSGNHNPNGLRYWLNEFATANEHGGDYSSRLPEALRAMLGSLIVFSILVFPQHHMGAHLQHIFLGAVWIGNIFMLISLQDSLGSCILTARDLFVGILMTTAVSYPVATFLAALNEFQAVFAFPFVASTMTFLLMSCPQLASRNIMVLIMYIIIAPVVREDIPWWQPLGWTATYFIGLAVAILVNLFPQPNLALFAIHRQLARLEKDFAMMLRQIQLYGENSSSATPSESRDALASIEMLYHRIDETIDALKSTLPAAQTELYLSCRSHAVDDLSEWVDEARTLAKIIRSLCTALTNRILGEEYQFNSQSLRDAKGVINDHISESRDRLVHAMTSSIAVCHAWADPMTRRVVLPDVQDELQEAMEDSRHQFQIAVQRAAHVLAMQDPSAYYHRHQNLNMPLFAHLARRMSASHSLLELAQSLVNFMNRHNWEAQEVRGVGSKSFGTWEQLRSLIFTGVHSYITRPWLWYGPDTFRLALKTAVGMFFGSLFISIPYLYNLATPFALWPGLTIASVNLATTGSSFRKAGDRLLGTLLAAAFALLVADLFPGTQEDYIKIPAIGLFTFFVIYLRTPDHAYAYTYAACSIGSMLYGSVSLMNEDDEIDLVMGYIPKRIELIFTGIVIFSIAELLLFPRSSRRLVETLSLQFFTAMNEFTKQASICAERIDGVLIQQQKQNRSEADCWLMMVRDSEDPLQIQKLVEVLSTLSSVDAKLKEELPSGLAEPRVGLSLELDAKSYRGLSVAVSDCEAQASLLVQSFQVFAKACCGSEDDEDGARFQPSGFHRGFLSSTAAPPPQLLANVLGQVHQITETACTKLSQAYPDGRIRPQSGNTIAAISAAATFRNLQDVRLSGLSEWSKIYGQAMTSHNQNQNDNTMNGDSLVDPHTMDLMALGITTTTILDLCRHLQKAGRSLEQIAHRFPPSK